jgi:hypothetical protein
MQPARNLDLDELPDSPYGAALRDADRRALGFSPDLEREFRGFQLEASRGLVRTWTLLVLVLMLLGGVRRLIVGGPPGGAPANATYGLILLPTWLAVTAVAWSARFATWYRPVARIALPLVTLILSVSAASMLAAGHLEGVTAVSIWVLSGHLLFAALFATGYYVVQRTCQVRLFSDAFAEWERKAGGQRS